MKILRRHLLVFLIVDLMYYLRMNAQGGYTLEPIMQNLDVPVRFAFAPDGSGRIFYLELLTGNVRVIDSDSSRDLWLHVNSSSEIERGLLGIAFDSQFSDNRYVYIFYTTQADTPANRVERYTEVNGRADTSSRMLLFEQTVMTPCGISTRHNGGALTFGTDGKLHISFGENNCPQLAADTTDPRGKILRIEPHIPAPNNAVVTNPFYDDGNPFTGNDDRIYAKGFRNPFGMTLSLFDSTIFVTENGPDCNDEINRVLPGHDYGWREECQTGPDHCNCSQSFPFTPPLWSITPTIAPTGLIVYNGSLYPELYARVIFVDWVEGKIRAGTLSPMNDSLTVTVISSATGGSLLDVVQGPDGYMYFSTYDAIWRLLPQQTDIVENTTHPRTVLLQNHPNPFNPKTDLRFEIGDWSYVSLKVYDVFGKETATLVDEKKSPGSYSVTWDANGMPSGVYFYRLMTQSFQDTKKMILLK
ncbi:MAG: PQQ-dependent sugar dehydrogenase [Ignavibacteriae bacterium]|nr:PQQ-dependent sugar dehydrogenase [Ignavibacteriota bacterium]